MDWVVENWALVALALVAIAAWLRGRQQARLLRALLVRYEATERAVLALAFVHRKPEVHAELLERQRVVSSAGTGVAPAAQEDLDRFVTKALSPFLP